MDYGLHDDDSVVIDTLKNAYYLIRISEEDEWKTAFRMEKGLFEYTVMPFGITNASASFQEMMDEIFKGEEKVLWYLDDMLIHGGATEEEHGITNASTSFQEMMDEIFQGKEKVLWYLDDMLIHGGATEEEHQKYVKRILELFLEHEISVNLHKSEFHQKGTDFLGYRINGSDIKMQPTKVNAIQDWPTPTKKKQVQAFLDFANYYRRFIKNYSAKVDRTAPLFQTRFQFS